MKHRGLVIGLTLLLAAFASDSWGQSQQPPQAQGVQADQQSKNPRASEDNSAEPAAQPNKSQTNSPESKAPDLKKQASDHSDHGAEEASEYWPFLIVGTRLKITDSLLSLFTFLL